MHPRSLMERWNDFAATSAGKRLVRAARLTFIATVLGVLAYQITNIGWRNVITSVPDEPLFYALLIASYVLLPVTEAAIYGRFWGRRMRECLPVMLRKRVLNVDILGYSGEFYLLLWARKRLAISAARVGGLIKDNLIASAGASLASAVITIIFLLTIGFVSVADFIQNPDPYYFALGSVAAVLIAALLVRFRSVVFHLPPRTVGLLGLLHTGRFLLGYILTILQWWIVIPTVSVKTWAAILVIFVVVNRIPFIPSSDLVLAGLGAELSSLFNIPVAPFLGMLLTRAAIERLLNLLSYSVTPAFETIDENQAAEDGDELNRMGAEARSPAEADPLDEAQDGRGTAAIR